MIQGLRTAIYKVSDMDQAKLWYAQAFDTKPYFDEPYYIGYNIRGFELGLQPRSENDPPPGENVLVYWGVDEIQDAYQRLVEMGAKEHESPTNVGGELMVATVKDPWDNILGLIYNPSFKIEEE